MKRGSRSNEEAECGSVTAQGRPAAGGGEGQLQLRDTGRG